MAILPRIVNQTEGSVISCGKLEVNPKSDQFDNYFGIAKMLLSELEKNDGFIENARYASPSRPGWPLSWSSWRNEKSLVRWSVETSHHKVMQAARDRVFAHFRMLIGEFVADTHLPAGKRLLHQRLDVAEVGIGEAITLLDEKRQPDWAKRACIDAVAKSPSDVIALVEWGELATAEASERDARLPEGFRNYGMFDRCEAPQDSAEVHPIA